MSDGPIAECCDRERAEIPSGNKYCHEAQIAEVKNGFVVKVGCKTFVGKAKDLNGLLGYFVNKVVPAKLNKLVKEREAFRGGEAQHAEGERGSEPYGPGIPSFLPSTDFGIVKATNGYVVIKNCEAYIATTKSEMVKLID